LERIYKGFYGVLYGTSNLGKTTAIGNILQNVEYEQDKILRGKGRTGIFHVSLRDSKDAWISIVDKLNLPKNTTVRSLKIALQKYCKYFKEEFGFNLILFIEDVHKCEDRKGVEELMLFLVDRAKATEASVIYTVSDKSAINFMSTRSGHSNFFEDFTLPEFKDEDLKNQLLDLSKVIVLPNEKVAKKFHELNGKIVFQSEVVALAENMYSWNPKKPKEDQLNEMLPKLFNEKEAEEIVKKIGSHMGHISKVMKDAVNLDFKFTLRNMIDDRESKLRGIIENWEDPWQIIFAYCIFNYLKDGRHPTIDFDKMNKKSSNARKKLRDVMVESNILSTVDGSRVELDNRLIRTTLRDSKSFMPFLREKAIDAAQKVKPKINIDLLEKNLLNRRSNVLLKD